MHIVIGFLFLNLIFSLPSGVPSLSEKPIEPSINVSDLSNQGRATTSIRLNVPWIGPKQTFYIILTIKPDDGWHIYWKNPGQSGSPTEFEISNSGEFKVDRTIYPRPTVFTSEEGLVFGYKKQTSFFIPVTAPERLSDGHVTFTVDCYWLACKENCVRGLKSLQIKIPTRSKKNSFEYKDKALHYCKSLLPKSINKLDDSSVTYVEDLLISGKTDFNTIRFIGEDVQGIRYDIDHSKLKKTSQSFSLNIPMDIDFNNVEGDTIVLRGLLLLGSKDTDPAFNILKHIRKK